MWPETCSLTPENEIPDVKTSIGNFYYFGLHTPFPIWERGRGEVMDNLAPIKWMMAMIFVVVWGRRWMGREWVFAWAG